MKKFIFILLGIALSGIVLVAVVGFFRFNFTDGGDIIPGINARVRVLSCTNGYTGEATYYAPNASGIMEKLSLSIALRGATTTYAMVPSVSASGAKFSTEDGAFSFWEHQDAFRFLSGEEELALCTEKKNAAPENTSEAHTRMSEQEARAIAENTCVKGGAVLEAGSYNPNSRTWWFDANLNATQPGCSPACVVSEETKTAEINWRCTGLTPPQHTTPENADTAKNLSEKTWIFTEAKKDDELLFSPKKKGVFTLTFEEGRVRIGTDCNNTSASYTQKGTAITFTEMMSTLMYCEGAEENIFTTLLGEVTAYEVRADTLILTLEGNNGVMYFK